MGHQFGHLYKIRRIVYFRLSPYEQKAFPNIVESAAALLQRAINQLGLNTIPFILTYGIIKYGNEANVAHNRKNPKDYENDS
ncbi:cytochrome b-c1 complex subunit 8 [Prorops nasuta]|uniref:cytochrome b-c1 complex subunit 8 n=1 Tax=Prorops nasuta TaxID=863751 RepID=UPI0034CF3119